MWTITDPVKVDQTLFVSTCHVYPHFCRVLGYLSRCARYPLALGANLHSFSVPTGALWHPRPMHAHPTVSSMWLVGNQTHKKRTLALKEPQDHLEHLVLPPLLFFSCEKNGSLRHNLPRLTTFTGSFFLSNCMFVGR